MIEPGTLEQAPAYRTQMVMRVAPIHITNAYNDFEISYLAIPAWLNRLLSVIEFLSDEKARAIVSFVERQPPEFLAAIISIWELMPYEVYKQSTLLFLYKAMGDEWPEKFGQLYEP